MVATRGHDYNAVGPLTRAQASPIGVAKRLHATNPEPQRVTRSYRMRTHPDVGHYMRGSPSGAVSPGGDSGGPAVQSAATTVVAPVGDGGGADMPIDDAREAGVPGAVSGGGACAPFGGGGGAGSPGAANGGGEMGLGPAGLVNLGTVSGVAAVNVTRQRRRPRKNPHPKHIPPGSREQGAQRMTMGAGTHAWRSAGHHARGAGGPASPASTSSSPAAVESIESQAMLDDTPPGTDSTGPDGTGALSGDDAGGPDVLPIPFKEEPPVRAAAIKEEPAWPSEVIKKEPATMTGAVRWGAAATADGEPAAFASAGGGEPVETAGAVKNEPAWPPVAMNEESVAIAGTDGGGAAMMAGGEPKVVAGAAKQEPASLPADIKKEPAWPHRR